MGKIKLNLADLRVDTFSTGQRDAGAETVVGQTIADSGCCTEQVTNCGCLTQFNTQCCPDDSAFSWGSCGTTCEVVPATCMDTECNPASEYMTQCVTGCQECNC